MMTSVTLPSTSGPIHGIYPTLAEPEEPITAEAELSGPARVPKRRLGQLSSSAAVAESCKKRRKQSTPVRISAAELGIEGKQPPPSSPSPTPPPSEHRCPVCQLYLPDGDQLQGHLAVDHCKREPEEETPLMEMTGGASQPWLGEMSGKEAWPMGLGLPPFPPAPSGMFMSLPQFAHQTTDTIARQPIRIFNPDAYCDLCNKEFCNKYFLKTHKANKHGIYSDPPSSSEQAGSSSMAAAVQIPSYSANIKLPTSVPSVEIPAIKTEPPVAAGSSIISPFSEIFQSPFTNKLFSKLNKAALPGLYETEQCENVPTSNGFSSNNSESDKAIVDDQPIEERSSPKNLTNIQAEPTSLIKNEPDVNVLYTSPSKMSPGQRELDYSNRLRRIGVMNPKAFCEICCKEYCNKYFLRTHKMKRHGIYIPDEKDKEYKSSESSSSNFSWAHNTQTSPLNLIMTEQSDRKTTSPADISCDMCGIRFQNASLAQLHNVNVHAKPFTRKLDALDNASLEESKKSDGDRPLNAEAISEDLQKLQTMILQLNDLDVSKVPTTCTSCNREFENRYFLHAHMMTEHGILLDDLTDAEKSGETENGANNNTLCDLCGKDVQNVEEMKKHMMESHAGHQPSSDNSKDDFNNGFSTPEKTPTRVPPASSAGSLPDRRISMSLTPTSSYCEICNKELCNKYFMKTHMQRMHGIEIENGAQIGGVICDICNKELCSKYFLRVHKHNTHGIVEYGTSLLQPRGKSDSEPPQGPQLTPETETALKPSDLADLSHRYFTHFTEVCSICSRRFRSTKWLKAHLLSDHGQMGAEKWAELEQQLQHTVGQHSKTGSKSERTSPTLRIPNGGQEGGGTGKVGIQSVLSSLFGVDESGAKNYQCSFCPFSTPLLPLLFVHERSHNMQQTGDGGGSVEVPLKCPVCTQSFLQPELLQHHMFSQHTFLPLPPFFNGSGSGETAGPAEPEEEVSSRCGGEETDGRVTTPKPTAGINKLRKVTKGAKLRVVPANESELGESLKDVAKKVQLPTTYAFPQEEQASLAAAAAAAAAGTAAGYVMQAFLLEESAAGQADRRVVPAVVFLPVLQKQPSPITLTFTLTPA